jgi:hypothetical protein
MSTRTFTFSRRLRPARLTACLAVALGLTLSIADAADAPIIQMPGTQGRLASAVDMLPYLRGNAANPHATRMGVPTKPAAPPHYVTTCGDDANTPGTLRYEVAHAVSGDTIDLSTLMCSTITLGSVISINVDSLYLKGPAAGPSHMTIDGGNHSQVFNHDGSSTLLISNLTITNGFQLSDSFANGGCIYSPGNVGLVSSIVSHCTIWSSSDSVPAKGGGVFVYGNLTLFNSTISDSEAFAQNGADEFGGGVYVKGDFKAKYSTISNNTAVALGGGQGDGGGVYTLGAVDIEDSTISGNSADVVGGLDLDGGVQTAKIINSTISSNTSTQASAGIWTNVPLTLANSTVAFNHSAHVGGSDGLFSMAPLTLQSSIIADNADSDGPSDLGGFPGVLASGANNVITSSTLPPLANTISDCPQLEPLANNGGTTRTHALKHTSPAINQGDAGVLTLDQRGAPRTAGIQADIGSVEWQPGETDERIFVNGFDGLCDQ